MSTSTVEAPEKALTETLSHEHHVAKFDEKIKFHKDRALTANDSTVFIAEMDEVYAAEEAKARFIKWAAKQPSAKKESEGSNKGFYIFAGMVATAQVFYGGYLVGLLSSM